MRRILKNFKIHELDILKKYDNPSDLLVDILDDQDNNSLVLLIDEYDAPLTHNINRSRKLNEIMDLLSDFYATIKQYTDKFRLIFITGITRANHVSIFSSFNNLKDISLENEYNDLLEFKYNDPENYFDLHVARAANILNMKKEDVYRRLKEHYEGFQFSPAAKDTLYNPWSILNFLGSPENGFCNYWFNSGVTPSIVMNYLKVNESFNFLDYTKRDSFIEINRLSRKYEITALPIDILLYQTGYLTLRSEPHGKLHLVLANTEVEESLLQLYLEENNLLPSEQLSRKMDDIIQYINKKDIVGIVNIFNLILNEYTSILSNIFNDERSVRDLLYAALIQIPSLQKVKERETVLGKSDLELITSEVCMIIEFKRTYPNRGPDASLHMAIDQIEKNRYGFLFSQSHMVYRVAMVISIEEKKILKNYCKIVQSIWFS